MTFFFGQIKKITQICHLVLFGVFFFCSSLCFPRGLEVIARHPALASIYSALEFGGIESAGRNPLKSAAVLGDINAAVHGSLTPASVCGLPTPASPPGVHVAIPPGVHVASPSGVHVTSPPGVHVASPPAVHVASPPAVHVASPPAVHVASQLPSVKEPWPYQTICTDHLGVCL